MNANISAVDLFCGVGGLSYGLSKCGISVRLGVDIDPASAYPMKKNVGASFLQADVSTLDPKIIINSFDDGSITLLAGCAPCQPFSTYSRGGKGKKRALSDDLEVDDWALVKRFAEIISQVEPDLVTMENVPPLADRPIFEEFVRSLKDYWIDWKIVECTDIGLPQTRKRLVLLASKLGPIAVPAFQQETKTVRQVIETLPTISAGESDRFDRLHRASKLSAKNLARIKASIPGGTWRDWPEELRADCHNKSSGVTFPSVYGRMEWDKPAPTITTQCFGYGNGRFGHPEQDRAISLREAAMLQGFPREYSFLPQEEPVSFARMGRLIGNAVPVDLGVAVGEVLKTHTLSILARN